jgi:hypothetical protein
VYPGGKIAGVGRHDTIGWETLGDGRNRMAKDICAGDTLLRPCVHRFPSFHHGLDPPSALA